MQNMQRELEELREDRARDKDLASRRSREDEDELRILRERCERLEAQNGMQVRIYSFPPYVHTTNSVIKQIFKQSDPDILEQLRADMENLMIELTDLSRRNDELMTAKDSDLIVIRDLDTQLKEYKRKYEQAKTELRNVKGMFSLSFPYFTLNHI